MVNIMSGFYEKAVGLTVYIFEDDSDKVLDKFERWDLDSIESKNVSKRESEMRVKFDDGSILDVQRSETDRKPMHVNFYPGDDEDNYGTSSGIIKDINSKLKNFDEYLLRSITVGVLTDGEVEDIANSFESPSSHDLTRIDFKDGEIFFKIIEEDNKVRTMASYENIESSFDLVDLKQNLMDELDGFLSEVEDNGKN